MSKIGKNRIYHKIEFMKKRIFIVLLLLSGICVSSYAAVPVHINSGNPAYPFPQFLDYAHGDSHRISNLGTKNPEGVVHIEMEQDIRDAYQIFANEWEYTGDVLDGVKYIRGNIGCPYDCREGDGYSMLAAAVMGDKESFDGLWFRIHDSFRPTSTSYLTGAKIGGGEYGTLIIGDQNNNCSATDGDNEIVLALYIAWRQWGDDSGHKAANGEMISYKKDLIEVTRGLVAMHEERFKTENPRRVTTGDVGLDGYLKNGTTWAEVTNWASQNATEMNGVSYIPEYAGPVSMHTDYSSPAYFREFYDLILSLDLPESTEWEREQYRRCEASCDWMVGNWLSQSAKNLFFGEEATISANNVVTLEAGNQGGRFRSAWRTALNYVWHGNPTYTWDPVTHTVKDGGNTFEKDWCDRFAEFMNDPQGWDGSSSCTEFGGGPSVTYKGPGTLHWDIEPDGTFPKSEFIFNWVAAVGMPAAIGSGDLDLAGILYRTCNIEWDITEGGDGYLTSQPHYFHGFFRWLGMLIATGNHQAPSVMKASANMKIYRAIEDSVTFAYTGDEIRYILDYRNFGTVDAENVVIVENVPDDFVFVSASDGGVYDAATHTITWNIGTVPGFKSDETEGPALDLKSGNLAKTIGQVSYKCKIGPKAFGRYCTTADISCSNGSGWTTNEYPNHTTATMQRNCVDVIKRALKIEKTSDVEMVNPGNLVEYKINFENSSEAGWLDGGRPRVSVGVSNSGLGTSQQWLRFRLYNDAIEPYIDYGNYRIAYYMYDAGLDCLAGEEDCPVGWGWYTAIYEGKRTATDKVNVTHETIVEGSDDYGRWNQRLCIQFAPLLVTTTAHLSNYYGMGARIHKGGTEPLRVAGYLYPSNWASTDFADDWSWDPDAQDAEDGNYHPVSPSWQNIDPETGKSIEIPLTEYLPSICEKPTHLVKNILVEEYDGYVWRRVLGTGPMAGREARDVVVIDTLPKGMEFVAFQNECPLAEYGASWDASKIADGRWVVKWEIPIMQVKQKGSIIYTAMASFPSGAECETEDELTQNVAWILADKNSPLSDTAEVTVTCAKVPKPIIPTTLVKTVDKEAVQVGDEVVYTIEYEQTHGAIFDDALANTSGWDLSGAQISGGTLSISQGNKATFNNSLSKNIYVEMDADIAQDQTGEIILRDDIRLQFKYNSSNGMSVSCLNGATEVAKATCALKNNPSRWRIKLQDDILQVWFGKDTSAGAAFTASDLPVKEGKLAFNGAAWGTFKYSNMHVHTDYAYNLSIIDRKPAEITFGSADEGGVLEGDSIVWKFEQGMDNPIPFGTKYKVSWTGTVDECNEKIINIAYAKLLGHADDEIMAQAVSECGSTCPIESVTLSADASEICDGDSTLLTATAEPEGDYLYEFFLDKESLGEPSTASELHVKAKGSYTVKVYDAADESCNMTSKAVAVSVDSIPAFDLGKDISLCSGGTAWVRTGLPEGYTYEWSTGSTEDSIEVDAAGEYSVVVTSSVCVARDTVVVSVADELVVDLGADTTVCAGALPYVLDASDIYDTYEWSDGSSESKLSVTEGGEYIVKVTQGACTGEGSVTVTVSEVERLKGTFSVTYLVGDTTADGRFANDLTTQDASALEKEEGIEYIWMKSDGTPLDGEPTPDVPAGGSSATETYKVYGVNADGCPTDTATIEVVISGAPVPTVSDVDYCVGETAQPLAATVSPTDDGAEWTLQWYDSDKKPIDAPTPATDASGETVYYVSQKTADGNESGLVEVSVKVYGVATPDVTGNRLGYCSGDTYENPSAKVEADPDKLLMSGGLEWTVGGKAWDGESAVEYASGEETAVSVKGNYEIAEGHVCESEEVAFIVKVTELDEPTGEYTVNYVKSEGKESGKFPSLTDRNDAVAKPSEGNTLVWYDGEGNRYDEAPAPEYDSDWEAGKDYELTYYVAQTDGTCESERVPVKVVISDSPMPKTAPVAYCQGSDAEALTADPNTTVDDADQYELLWYESLTGGEAKTTVTPYTEKVGVTKYYVSQKHKESGAESSRSELVVTVHALPELTATAPDAQCGGSVDLTKVFSEKNGLAVDYSFYDAETAAEALPSAEVEKSGTYYAEGYYEINMNATTKATCRSAVRTPVEVKIHDLSDLTIEGDETVCPGATATITAKATSAVPGTVTYSWEGGEDSESGEYVTPAMEGAYNTVRTFKVEASAGACVKTLSGTFDVKIDRGVLTGAMSVNGEATDLYKTCGGESLTLSTTHEGTDIRWTTTDGEPVGEGAEQTVNPAETTRYVVTLTNVCETSDTVTVKVMPLSVTADWTSLATTVCEGDGFSASLAVEGYDPAEQGAYVRWYKDGEELTEYAGKTSIGKVAAEASDAGAYSYKVSNGICELPEDEDMGELKVVEKPTFSVTEGVVSCSGDPVEIGVTLDDSDAEIIWKDDSSTEATRTVSPTEDTEYAFTVSRGGVCKVDGMLEVSVKSKPAVVLRDDTICSGHTIKLRAFVTGDGLTAYEWKDESGAPLSGDVTVSVTPEATSTYTFTVSSESCGEASGEVTVTVNPTPEIEVDSISLRDREIVITNEDYSADYLYKLDKGEWQEENLFENISFNLHTVYVQDNHGCEGSLMFELKAPEISIPIVFTPNDDGVQDGWDVSNILESYPSASVVIYDRFGKVIAELQGDTSSWDGTYNGNPLPSTDYWYTIRIPEIIKIYNGHFTLIRSK